MILETERLVLREWTPDDVDDLLRIFSDPVAMSFYPSTYDRKEALGWIEWQIGSYARDGYGLWASFDKATGDFVGQCGIFRHDVAGVVEDEIGYHTLRELWGKGYASEAAIACRDYGFKTLELDRLVSWMRAEHTASRRVAEKAGMTLEKTATHSREGYEMVVYSVSRSPLPAPPS